MTEDMFAYIADAEAFIDEIAKIIDIDDKKARIFKDDKFIVTLKEIRDLGQVFQYERLLENIGDLFLNKGKGKIVQQIKDAIGILDKKSIKDKTSKFTDSDISDLPTRNGQIIATPEAYRHILLGARNVRFVWDTMSDRTYMTRIDWDAIDEPFYLSLAGPISEAVETYHKYTDSDTNQTLLKAALNRGPFPTEPTFGQLSEIVKTVAQVNKIDFYQRWMLSHEGIWDGIDRFNGPNCWAVRFLGAKNEEWSNAWARVLMLAIVRRCLEPGCQLRYYFVIEGEQNIGKSEFCRLLVPLCWHTTSSLAQAKENQDEFNRSTYNKAIVELPELGGTDKASINAFKKIVTEHESTFRGLYEKVFIAHPKRNVLIITTNEEAYLRDATGESRSAPIKSLISSGQFMDLQGFVEEYPQILAQAIHMYRQGMLPFFTNNELPLQKQETDKRDMTLDFPEYEIIQHYFADEIKLEIAKREGIYLDLIYQFMFTEYEILKKDAMKQSRRIGAALTKYGFTIKSPNVVWCAEAGKPVKMWYWPKRD